MEVNAVRNYYDFIIVCDNIDDVNIIIDLMMDKVKRSKELESFNITSKIKYLYLIDGSKYKFITKRHFSKAGLRMKGKIIDENTFVDIVANFNPRLKNFVDIMNAIMISDLDKKEGD